MTQGFLPPFKRKASFDSASLVGARWWHEALEKQTAQVSRRNLMIGIVAGTAAFGILSVGVGTCATTCCKSSNSTSGDIDPADLAETQQEALDTQAQLGWNVGATDKTLSWPGESKTDCDGRTIVPAVEALVLDRELSPPQLRLVPYYGSTLFRAPSSPSGAGLNDAVKAVFSDEMGAAFARARGIASQFDGTPQDLVVILDLPGPEGVAAAAGLAEKFEPVFVYDNWPHPLGVVPSHLVLGAALFFRPFFPRAAQVRKQESPPVFVLDANRLLPYSDDAKQFDNRYVARIPSWDRMKEMGFKRVLYVRPDGEHMMELDDLNDDFCNAVTAEMDVKTCVMTDFREDPEADAGAADARVADADAGTPGDGGVPPPKLLAGTRPHYYGGHMHTHIFFMHDYGWAGSRRPPVAPRPTVLGSTYAYKPARRATVFSGMVRQPTGTLGKPSGFGLVTVNRSKSSGSAVSVGRSGSLGRVGGGSSTSGGGYHPSSGG
jgi:hypothetical protein